MHERMARSTTFRKAKEFSKNRKAAARIRIRYLDEWVSHYLQDDSPVAMFWACEALEEICYLTMESLYTPVETGTNITDDMIARAKGYPVEELIDFYRGRAIAFCHADKRPSLYKGNKGDNKVVCPVCNKTFSSIDILVKRDGYSFVDAVKRLC